jgi:hypothetical protein
MHAEREFRGEEREHGHVGSIAGRRDPPARPSAALSADLDSRRRVPWL